MSTPHKQLLLTEAEFHQLEAYCKCSKSLMTLLGKASTYTPSSPEQRQAAIDRYGSDDIEVDEDARISEADEGYWVQAWVWLSNPEEAPE